MWQRSTISCGSAVSNGCVDESLLSRTVEELELDDEGIDALRERLAGEGIDVRDDCGQSAPPTAVRNGELAGYTTDALQLFLNEAGRYPLLTPAEEVELSKADRAPATARPRSA